MARRVGLYFSWDRRAETDTPLGDLNNRFPALHEVRRQFWPRYEALAQSPGGQGIQGFLQAIFLQNFVRFCEQTAGLVGRPVEQLHRRSAAGETFLTEALLESLDTLIVISFDSVRTDQAATDIEVEAVRSFLARPEAMLFVCPHHDIGDTGDLAPEIALSRQIAEFNHHGDVALPGQQLTGGFARSLMAGLGAPIRNRFGLRPASDEHGEPAPFHVAGSDRDGLLRDVPHLNLHPHLPHFERVGDAELLLEVLVRQIVDPTAPPHPVMPPGGLFDAVLQARADAMLGRLVICDATLWTSAFGGLQGLQAFWKNAVTA